MNIESRADFINSVVSGTNIPCPECGTSNKPGSEHCVSCGAEIKFPQETRNNTPAFAPTQEVLAKDAKYTEPNNVFAQGLPSWSIEPPQVMVRRR